MPPNPHPNSQHVEGPADDPVVRDGILAHELGPLELGKDDDEEEEEGVQLDREAGDCCWLGWKEGVSCWCNVFSGAGDW